LNVESYFNKVNFSTKLYHDVGASFIPIVPPSFQQHHLHCLRITISLDPVNIKTPA